MKEKSWFHSVAAATVGILLMVGSNGCTNCKNNTVDASLKKVVVFHYDHVANAHEIRFRNNLQLPGTSGIGSVNPKEGGFWAIFVLCSLDVKGKTIETFNYDVSKFFVEYEGESFGPLQPFNVRYAASTSLNNSADTPAVAAAIAKEVQLGPSTQAFSHGFYPSLNYRIAILIPRVLPTYRGEQLTLTYKGQPSLIQGGGDSPEDIPVLGDNFGSVADRCRPPAP